MPEAVELSLHNGVADLRLNRPDKMNAVDEGIMTGLRQALETIRNDATIRCVVISGNGKGFCAGLDFSNFGDMLSGDLTADGVAEAYDDLSPAGANQAQLLGWGWQELPIPVIAAVHGAALGGGLNIALGADIRIVHPDTKMGFVDQPLGATLKYIAIGIETKAPMMAALLVVFFQKSPKRKTARIPGLTIPVYSCINWKA